MPLGLTVGTASCRLNTVTSQAGWGQLFPGLVPADGSLSPSGAGAGSGGSGIKVEHFPLSEGSEVSGGGEGVEGRLLYQLLCCPLPLGGWYLWPHEGCLWGSSSPSHSLSCLSQAWLWEGLREASFRLSPQPPGRQKSAFSSDF